MHLQASDCQMAPGQIWWPRDDGPPWSQVQVRTGNLKSQTRPDSNGPKNLLPKHSKTGPYPPNSLYILFCFVLIIYRIISIQLLTDQKFFFLEN